MSYKILRNSFASPLFQNILEFYKKVVNELFFVNFSVIRKELIEFLRE